MQGSWIALRGRRFVRLFSIDRAWQSVAFGGMAKIAMTVYLDPDQHKKLSALSKKTYVPMASYVRQALLVLLEQHADTLAEALRDNAA